MPDFYPMSDSMISDQNTTFITLFLLENSEKYSKESINIKFKGLRIYPTASTCLTKQPLDSRVISD